MTPFTTKGLVAVGAGIAMVVGSAVLTLREIGVFVPQVVEETRATPTVEAVEKNAHDIHKLVIGDSQIREDIDRIRSVQAYQLELTSWQSEVLDHIGQRRRGKPPKRPERLKVKAQELMK